jgi:hypothetical protein
MGPQAGAKNVGLMFDTQHPYCRNEVPTDHIYRMAKPAPYSPLGVRPGLEARPHLNSLFDRYNFLIRQLPGGGVVVEHLSDNFFNWLLFHAEVMDLAIRKNDPASFGYFISGDFQLNGSRRAFDNFP